MLKIAFDKTYVHPLKKNHRFPMIKYELLPEQLLRKNICSENSFFSPDLISKKDAILTHGETYYDELVGLSLSKSEQRQIGFPLSEALIGIIIFMASTSTYGCPDATSPPLSCK